MEKHTTLNDSGQIRPDISSIRTLIDTVNDMKILVRTQGERIRILEANVHGIKALSGETENDDYEETLPYEPDSSGKEW